MVRTLLIGLALVFALSACEEVKHARGEAYDEMYEWVNGHPPPEPEPRIMDSRYCYKTQADILCYDTPQLGKEDQFIGAQ